MLRKVWVFILDSRPQNEYEWIIVFFCGSLLLTLLLGWLFPKLFF